MKGIASPAGGLMLIVMEKNRDRWRCRKMAFLLMRT
jgi:hypothetical protein